MSTVGLHCGRDQWKSKLIVLELLNRCFCTGRVSISSYNWQRLWNFCKSAAKLFLFFRFILLLCRSMIAVDVCQLSLFLVSFSGTTIVYERIVYIVSWLVYVVMLCVWLGSMVSDAFSFLENSNIRYNPHPRSCGHDVWLSKTTLEGYGVDKQFPAPSICELHWEELLLERMARLHRGSLQYSFLMACSPDVFLWFTDVLADGFQ